LFGKDAALSSPFNELGHGDLRVLVFFLSEKTEQPNRKYRGGGDARTKLWLEAGQAIGFVRVEPTVKRSLGKGAELTAKVGVRLLQNLPHGFGAPYAAEHSDLYGRDHLVTKQGLGGELKKLAIGHLFAPFVHLVVSLATVPELRGGEKAEKRWQNSLLGGSTGSSESRGG
jgi:hypothetical protein